MRKTLANLLIYLDEINNVKRDHGNLLFIDITRSLYTITQCTPSETSKKFYFSSKKPSLLVVCPLVVSLKL